MKVRSGWGWAWRASPSTFSRLVDDLDDLGFDSVWLPEVLTAPTLDPLVGLSFAAAHNPRLKLGTTMLLPGRNPVRLAKELATLDVLSGGRLLCTFVPGLPRRPEVDAAGVAGPDKAGLMDEMLPLLRSLWAGETVTHHGMAAHIDQVSLSPLPVQQPLEFWTGGMVPAALRRCGRFADGWLPSACTPAEVAAARVVIDESAAEAGRAISPEHFGVSVAYAHGTAHPGCGPGRRDDPPGGRPRRGRPGGHRRAPIDARGVRGGGLLQVRGPSPGPSRLVAGRARVAGRGRPRSADMTRSRPLEFVFGAHDDPELLAHMAEVEATGTGWINVVPVIEEEHEPPPPGPFAFLGGSTHQVPTVTWVPGKHLPDGTTKPTTVGLQHAAGPHLAWKLRDLGLPLPDGWRITQDHPRRGLVALVPSGADNREVMDWLLRLAAAVCTVPATGRWEASVHAGLP